MVKRASRAPRIIQMLMRITAAYRRIADKQLGVAAIDP
jgi:hypothetical protein